MLTFSNIAQIETLFTTMEPANLAGESFTPSLHPEELLLDDVPPEPEEEDVPVPLAAIDAGVIDVGLSRRGFALAFKAAVVTQELDATHTITKIGPRVKFIEPDNRAKFLRFIGRELMNEDIFVEVADDGSLSIKAGSSEPNQFKDSIRNFIERMLQLDIARQLRNGILLVDGSLTLRTYNTPAGFS